MKLTFFIATIVLVSTACNQNSRATTETNEIETTNRNEQKQQPKRLSFKSIFEVIADSSSSVWVERQESSFSLALHFQEKDTLAFSYSPECWLAFPYKRDQNQLTVYWDDNIDTKYEFDIVKAVKKVDTKYIGKPFLILGLLNDTTLSASYPLDKLRTHINNSSTQRIFFPDRFYVVQEGELYD